MPNFLYENDERQTPVPEDGGRPDAGQTEPNAVAEEEFDISSFDFTIADPGEIAEFSDTVSDGQAQGAAPSAEDGSPQPARKKKEKPSLKKFSAALSDKVTKLMEETPKEEKERKKKNKPSKPAPADTPLAEERWAEPKKPPRGKLQFGITGGSFSQIARRWMRYALRPAALYENLPEWIWPLFLLAVMLFFGGFYLLIGLDWYFAGLVSAGRLWAIAGIGLPVGGTAALAFAAGTLGLSLLCRKESLRPFRVLSTVAGSCVYPALLLVLGLLIQLIFKAAVSMSFGLMAVLWLMYILLDVLRDLFGEKHLFKSTVLILLWGLMLFIVMSLTFTLK